MESYEIRQISSTASKEYALWRKMQTSPYTDTFTAQIEASVRDVFILTVRDDFVAECALVYDSPDYGTAPDDRLYLSRLIVRKDSRGNGYGETLARHVLAAAKEKGYKSIALGVNCDNTAAVSLYRKLGFSVYEEAEDDGGKFYRMEKAL